jgi:hypothetical protein
MIGLILERTGDLAGASQHLKDAALNDPVGDICHSFQAARLKGRPTTANELKQILADVLAQNPKWSTRVRRTARAAAANSAVWYARESATGIKATDRVAFRELARNLFAELIAEFAKEMENSSKAPVAEMINATANWLGDNRLSHLRGLSQLAALPADEAAKWSKLWESVHGMRKIYLQP